MNNGGYTGALPIRDDSPEAYSGAWDLEEQFTEVAAGRWAQTTAGIAPRSVRLNSADSAFFSRTPSVAGNRRVWTWSGWIKRSSLNAFTFLLSATSNPGTVDDQLRITDSNTLSLFLYNGGDQANVTSTAVFRDPSAWYHIVCALDTTQATASNRVKFYVNGQQITAFGTANYPAQNYESSFNAANLQTVGSRASGSFFSGALYSNIHFIDGQALLPEAFGFFDGAGIWQPRRYRGTYGANGFYLDFSDNSGATATTLGADRSNNGNNWTPNNISVTAGAGNDSLVDSPVSYGTDTSVGGEVRGNYCTLNPLDKNTNFTLSNGNLDGSTGTSTWRGARGTFGVTSGKWYFECIAGSPDTMVGIADATTPITDPTFPGYTAYSYGYYGQGGVKYNNNTGTAYGSVYTTNDVIGVAFDADNGRLFFSKNGTWQASGDPAAGTNPAFTGLTGRVFFPMLATYSNVVANFGQRPFAYTAPSGFKALCTANLPEPAIKRGDDFFQTVLYTGNGTVQTINGLRFSPDLAWIKIRGKAYWHELIDSVRGANKTLFSNTTDAETTINTLTSFNADGFTLGTNNGANNGTNEAAGSYVAWTWDAGSSTVTNTQGTITSTVRANPSAGFSIVTYSQGASNSTVGHGLGAAPHMIIAKSRTSASGRWDVFHRSLGRESYMYLDGANAAATYTDYWGSVLPTSTTFGVSLAGNFNNLGSMVAYCFAPVPGLSAFGSYIGNGSADGPFTYTGFRPRWILFKNASVGVEDWWLHDTARNTYNVMTSLLVPNSANAESTNAAHSVDALSNGFKIRTTAQGVNGSGHTIVYCAFAESPFQYARAR